MAKPMSHQTGIIIIVSDMGIYNGEQTGEDIDAAVNAVKGITPDILQLVRDEIRTQLFGIGTTEPNTVPVFNASGILQHQTFANFVMLSREQGNTFDNNSDADNYTEAGLWLKGNNVTVSNLPSPGSGFLEVKRYSGARKQEWNDISYKRTFCRYSWGSVVSWTDWYEVTYQGGSQFSIGGVQIKASDTTYQNGTCCLLGQLAVLYTSIQVIGSGYKFINVIITRESTAVYRMYGQITGFKIYVDSSTNNVYLVAPTGTAIRPVVMSYHPSNILNCTFATLPSGATEITVTT